MPPVLNFIYLPLGRIQRLSCHCMILKSYASWQIQVNSVETENRNLIVQVAHPIAKCLIFLTHTLWMPMVNSFVMLQLLLLETWKHSKQQVFTVTKLYWAMSFSKAKRLLCLCWKWSSAKFKRNNWTGCIQNLNAISLLVTKTLWVWIHHSSLIYSL